MSYPGNTVFHTFTREDDMDLNREVLASLQESRPELHRALMKMRKRGRVWCRIGAILLLLAVVFWLVIGYVLPHGVVPYAAVINTVLVLIAMCCLGKGLEAGEKPRNPQEKEAIEHVESLSR